MDLGGKHTRGKRWICPLKKGQFCDCIRSYFDFSRNYWWMRTAECVHMLKKSLCIHFLSAPLTLRFSFAREYHPHKNHPHSLPHTHTHTERNKRQTHTPKAHRQNRTHPPTHVSSHCTQIDIEAQKYFLPLTHTSPHLLIHCCSEALWISSSARLWWPESTMCLWDLRSILAC